MTTLPDSPIRIGVSSCLLGEQVRYDGGHKKDSFLVDVFGRFVEWVPVCPEFEIGLGIPREPIRLERKDGQIRLVTIETHIDHTQAMRRWSKQHVGQLAIDDLSGYVLKSRSPSCGMERVRVYDKNGVPSRDGRGLFAEVLLARLPNLPVEEEGRLNDPKLRENFIERVFAYYRLQALFRSRWKASRVIDFHTGHKLLLMAHSPQLYRELGRLVAGIQGVPRKGVRTQYESLFMRAMAVQATRGRHTNVLQHMAGYLTDHLDRGGREELAGIIADYRQGLIPLIVPITLIRHYVRRFDIDYLKGQLYLEPHPKELMLRNHV